MAFDPKKLKEFRKSLKLSQSKFGRKLEELALELNEEKKNSDRTGCSVDAIRRWEQGINSPSAEGLELIQIFAVINDYDPMKFYDIYNPIDKTYKDPN